jgi:hypothetical protein
VPDETLTPSLELLSQEYVLVQAWKKTSAYIRYHNWYADTLALDHSAVNLPQFLRQLSDQLRNPTEWANVPLRMVPAPKSQQWVISPKSGDWGPKDRDSTSAKLRPLAHVDLRSQVAATAVMMCLADSVESAQGDPRSEYNDEVDRKLVSSYGNRLFCDKVAGGLRHRWGSSKLYRAYFQDYRTFIARPEAVAVAASKESGAHIVVVQSDLSQFYDRVRPELLAKKLSEFVPRADSQFLELSSRVLSWTWDTRDEEEVATYSRQTRIKDFASIALPQGLVSAGFFANVVLLDLDRELRMAHATEPLAGICLLDSVRYVDDLRLVLDIRVASLSLEQIEADIATWLQALVDRVAAGLQISSEKTLASAVSGEGRPLIRQSRKMSRIQNAISGGFDSKGGVEILDAVQGLIRSQQRYAAHRNGEEAWSYAPIPDVKDATVARFAAGRYRATYRSLRPMLSEEVSGNPSVDSLLEEDESFPLRGTRTQDDLDEEVRAFALGLVESWIDDPANVRLLRIGLDLWPTPDLLEHVLRLLRPFTVKGGSRNAPRRVAWYCLAEIFRAAATETGFVADEDALPKGVDLTGYRAGLVAEAIRLTAQTSVKLPWYLRQQMLLFLAANDPTSAPFVRTGKSSETRSYRELILYLRGEGSAFTNTDFSTLSVLARRSFATKERAIELALQGLGPRRLEQIAERDPSFALELLQEQPSLVEAITPRLRDDLCVQVRASGDAFVSLAQLGLEHPVGGPLRNELSLLAFAISFLTALVKNPEIEAITPVDVRVELQSTTHNEASALEVRIVNSRVSPSGSVYLPPAWCEEDQHWRFRLGYLLRFILTARADFTTTVRKAHWKEDQATYRPGVSHWYQRLHGLFNGHQAFGDDWLPISEWIEHLLSGLLRWPGQRGSPNFEFLIDGIDVTVAHLQMRRQKIEMMRGPASGLLMLPLSAPWPVRREAPRPLRACVVQTVVPAGVEFDPADLSCSSSEIRKKHRRHLSAALAAIERMLDLRETHKGRDGRLDWLILPELAVHPKDVQTHLIPFARAHKAVVLTGITYEELFSAQPLINSAMWIVPTWDAAYGLQIRVRRQGKQHLAPMEDALNAAGPLIQGFRPCQWLVGYEWAQANEQPPLWLTASICYDATDLALATDLRNQSDVFAIPALNLDVGTFDQMSLALHYHMFQMVVIANNGLYGGSNAYAPYKESYNRQVFHMHGQPQASVSFFEIEPIELFQQRKLKAGSGAGPLQWKSPPAGLV